MTKSLELVVDEPVDAEVPEVVALAALNAVIVAFAAMGVYERAIALPEAQKNDELVNVRTYVEPMGTGQLRFL